MTMEMTVRIAVRLRQLSDDQFEALRLMVEDGDEPADEPTLAAVCEALADCAGFIRDDAPARTPAVSRRTRLATRAAGGPPRDRSLAHA